MLKIGYLWIVVQDVVLCWCHKTFGNDCFCLSKSDSVKFADSVIIIVLNKLSEA